MKLDGSSHGWPVSRFGHTSGAFQTQIHAFIPIDSWSARKKLIAAFQHLISETRAMPKKTVRCYKTGSNTLKCSLGFQVCYIHSSTKRCDTGEGANLREMGTDDGTCRGVAPVGVCADMWDMRCTSSKQQIERDLWQVAFKSLPLGNTVSLTGLLKAQFGLFPGEQAGVFSPPSSCLLTYPPLSLQHHAKSALSNRPPLTHQMCARQPPFQTEFKTQNNRSSGEEMAECNH